MTRAIEAAGPSEIAIEVEVETRRARVSGCLDICTAPVLVDTVCSVLPLAEGDVVLDLESLRFLDAAGMRGLVDLVKVLRPYGRRLVLEGLSGRQVRLLTVAGLDNLVPDPRAAPEDPRKPCPAASDPAASPGPRLRQRRTGSVRTSRVRRPRPEARRRLRWRYV